MDFKILTEEQILLVKFFLKENIFEFIDFKMTYPLLFTNFPLYYQWNAIVCLNSFDELRKKLSQITSISIFNIELRILFQVDSMALTKIRNILECFEFHNIHLFIHYNDIKEIIHIFKNISYYLQVFVLTKSTFCTYSNGVLSIIRLPCDLNLTKACGKITQKYFNAHYLHVTEAQHHNTCLNRKISIDVNGDIKNCPSMSESFGNIKDTTLAEAIEKPGFKKYWNINKDKIHVCKDCEFRYICTDCRAYVEDPQDIYSKPLKCGYNPYTGEWEEWSTHPLKQKAIDYYGMREILEA